MQYDDTKLVRAHFKKLQEQIRRKDQALLRIAAQAAEKWIRTVATQALQAPAASEREKKKRCEGFKGVKAGKQNTEKERTPE